MEVIESLEGVSIISVMFLYAILAFGAFYTLNRFGINRITILIVLVFWEGLLYYLSNITIFNYNYYKIFIFIYAVLFFAPNISKKRYKPDLYTT